MKARILLVEDDYSLGETLTERLLKEGYDIDWRRDLGAAREALRQNTPDILILDVRLPDGSGFDLAEELRKAGNNTPFIFLTAQAGAPERLRGFELGAEEFIPKPFHIKELLIRLQHVLSTHRHAVTQKNYIYSGHSIDFEAYQIHSRAGLASELTRRDMALLSYLIEERQRVVSRDEILDRLWGEDKFPTNRTVDNAIVRIRQAFGDDGVGAIQSVRGVGYRWIGELLDA